MKKLFVFLIFGILLVGTLGFFILKKDTIQEEALKPTYEIVKTAQGTIIKEYVPNEKLLRLRDIETESETLSVKLNTPQDNHVGAGYEKVAQFTINSKQDYNFIIGQFELYDKKNNGVLISRQIDVKYLTTQQVEENVYDNKCSLSINETTQTCEQIVVGTRMVEQEAWLPFDNSVKTNEEIVIGLFTDVQVGDKIEWIPTIAGVRVQEWAVWTSDLNVDLEVYYDFEDADESVSHTLNLTANEGAMNYTTTGALIGKSGRFTVDNNLYLANSSQTNIRASEGTHNFWYYADAIDGDVFYNNYADWDFNQQLHASGYLYSTGFIDGAAKIGYTLNAGAWTMITYLHNSSGAYIYINGSIAYSGVITTTNLNDFAQKLGVANDDGYDFIGYFDEMGYWSRPLSHEEISVQLYNSGVGMTYVPSGISVTLLSPEDNANLTTNDIDFSANISDPSTIGIQNVTLEVVYPNGTLFYNETNTSGFEGVYNLTDINISDGNWNWSVNAYDDANEIYESDMRVFLVDTIVPEVVLLAPPLIVDFHSVNTNLSVNWSANDTNIDTCILQFEGSNRTVTCSDNQTEINITNSINRSIIFYVNDTVGNINSTSRSWNYTIFENSQEFNEETPEGIINTFTANVTIGESKSITTASLIYNETSNTGSFSPYISDSFILTIDFLIPNVDVDTNLTFFWSLLLSDDQIINLTSHNQTVISLSLDNCSVNTVVLYNYTIVDEKNQSLLSNTTTELNFNLLDITRQNYVVNFSQKYLNINPFAVCINQNLSYSTYAVDSIVKYEATGYAVEYYNIVNATITNSTIPMEITLYDLFSEDSTEFKITFKAEDFTFVEDALIYIDRQYIAENNTFKTVELPKTDSNGQTVGHFVRNEVVYNIRVIKWGVVLGNFKNIIAFCEDYTIGACQMILEATPEDLVIFNYDAQLGIIFQTLPSYNEDTSSISFDFSTDDGTIKTVLMDVTRDDIFGNRSICNNTLTSSSGTLICSFDPNIDDSVLRVGVSVDGQPVVLSSVRLESSDYGNLGYVLWFFLTFLFILLFAHSKTEVLIGLGISSIGAISLGITRGDIIGLGSAGIWILVIIILGILKLNKERPQ